jgi:para-aminobenzoate synthetase/4-amino-4-deoxychorismate lyase
LGHASVKAAAAPRMRRVRLSLTKAGDVACTTAPMTPLADGPIGLLIARECGLADTHADDFLLGFKNTHRAQYDRAWQMAEREGAFDAVFMNTHGHLTEGGRTNLFVKLGGRWYTPPLSDGVLPGVMRAVLLEDPAWQASERTLVLGDLLHAEALVLTNALRGAMPACLRTCVPAPETSPLSPHAHTPRSPR